MRKRETFLRSKKTRTQKKSALQKAREKTFGFLFRGKQVSPIVIYLVTGGVIMVGVFLAVSLIIFLSGQVADQAVKQVRIEPKNCIGWNNADAATTIDAIESTDINGFAPDDSAFITVSHSADVTDEAEHSITCSDFELSYGDITTHEFENAELLFSFGALGVASEDVLSFLYSTDGLGWHELKSFELGEETSNKTNGGYLRFPLRDYISIENIDQLQIQLTLHSKSQDGITKLVFDGVGVDVQVQKRIAVPDLPEDVVRAAKFDFQKNESPEISVKIQDKSLWSIFGKSPSIQSVKSARLYHPSSDKVTSDFEITEMQSGFDTLAMYKVPKDEFTKPGLYVAEFEIEKNGVTKVIQEDFLWGVIAMNVRTAVNTPGGWTDIGMALLEQDGKTQCSADLVAEVTFPNGHVESFSTDNGTIIVNETCVDGSVTNEPDYLFRVETLIPGEYQVKAWTNLPEGQFIYRDSFYIVESPEYIITRAEFPTRIFPVAAYPVTFTVTPSKDFSGEVTETVPSDFALSNISNDGTEVDTDDPEKKTIVWSVDWKAGETYALSYTFDAPDISPEFYELGPLRIGAYEDYRTWEIASDSLAGTSAVNANVNATESKHMSPGRNMVVTDTETEYVIYVGSNGYLYYSSATKEGIASWPFAAFLVNQTDVEKVSVWYDQWTPGNTGDLIHIAYLRSGDDTVYYMNLDTSDNTASTPVSVYSDSATTRASTTDSLSITVASDGDIYVVSSSSAASAVSVVYFSNNGGTSFSATADEGLDDGQDDYVQLMPLASGDVLLIRWDISADDIQSKEYEDGANTWDGSWANVDTNAVDSATYTDTWGATLNPSSNDIYLAYTDTAGAAGSDLRTATYNGSTWANKTDVETNVNYIVHSAIAYDSANDDIYVVYNAGVAVASLEPFYRVSTDAMTSWGPMVGGLIKLAPTDATAIDDFRGLHVNLVSDQFIGVWTFDDDDNDLFFGRVIDIGYDSQTLLFTNYQGFESADVTDASATSGSPTFNSSIKRSGDYSLEINPVSGTEYVDYPHSYNTNGTEYSTTNYGITGQFALYIDTTPSVETTIFLNNYLSSTVRFEIKLDTSRNINISGSGSVSGSYALSLDTWYVIAFNIQGYPYDHAQVRVYSSDMGTIHETLYETGTDDWSYGSDVRIGVSQTSATATLYFDDILLYANRYATGQFPLLEADYAITPMGLDSAGSDTGWTNDYTALDEIPTSNADYIYTSAIADETSNLESASSAGIDGDILGVRVMNNLWEPSSCSSNIRGVRSCGSTCGFGVPETVAYTGLATTETEFVDLFNVNNFTLAFESEYDLLSTTFLDNLQTGVASDASGCEVRNSATVVQVLHIPIQLPDITGSLYSDEGSTKITASAKTIVATVNGSTTACGGAACTAETASGDFTISNITISSAGDVITVYVDGETEKAVTVTRAASTSANITALDLYQDTVIVRHEDAGPTTNANLGQYDADDDADIPFTSNTNALTVSTNTELHVWTGDTYDPGGTVTTQGTGDFHVEGIASLDTATNTIADQILVPTGGELTVAANTNVNGNTSTVYVSGGTFIQTAGTLTVGDSTVESMLISSGVATFSGGTTIIADEFDLSGGTLTISNTFTLSSSSSYFEIYGGSTANINSGADINLSDRLYLHDDGTIMNVSDGSSIDSYDYWLLYSGTFNFNGGTHNVSTGDATGSLYMNGSTVTGITFNMSGNGTIYTRELETSNNARNFTGAQTGGTIVINGDNPTLGLNVTESTNAMNFYNVTIAGTTTSVSTSTANIVNDLTINSGQTFTTNNATIPVGHDLILNSTAVMVAGSSSITVGGSFTDSGTFTADTSTVTMSGTGNINGSSDTSFYNLTVGDGSAGVVTVSGTNDPSITNSLNVDTGDTLTIDTGRVVTYPNGTGTFTFAGTINGSGRFDFQDLTPAFPSGGTQGSTLTIRFDTATGNMTFNARTFDGPVEVYNNSGVAYTVYGGGGTSTFNSTVDLISVSGSATLDLDAFAQTNTVFYGDVTIGTGTIFEAASETLYFDQLTFTDNGTFNHNNGTISFVGVNSDIRGTSDTVFYDLDNSYALNVLDIDDLNDPVVMGTFTHDSGSGGLVVNAGRTFTIDDGATYTWLGGALDGTGIFIYQPSTAFPTGGVFTSNATVRFDSTQVATQTMSARTYMNVEVYGNNTSNSVVAAAGSYTIAGDLTTTQSGTGTTTFNMDTNDPSITLNGDFTIGTGTYIDEGSGTTDLNGNLTKQASATWSRNTSGTVLLSGTTLQTVDATGSGFAGSQALQNLTITNNSGSDAQSDPSVKFLGTVSSYGTYTITTANVKVQYDNTGTSETLNVNWNSPDANKIYFRSTSAGTQFTLNNYDSTDTVNDVDVKDAYNNGTFVFNATDASNVNSGNNYRWNFGAMLATGTVYSTLTGTAYNCSSNNLTINVSVNGDATPDSGTCTASDGTFSFSVTQPTGADEHVVVYIDGAESVSATTATLTSGIYSDADVNLYIDYVAIDSESGTAMTNTLLDTFDAGNDADIDYTVTAGSMTVSSGHGLYIAENYTSGGSVTTPASSANAGTITSGGDGDLIISSTKTLNVGSSTVSIGGDFDNNGTYTTSGTQSTIFTGTTTGFTIDRGSSVFRDMSFNGSGGGWSSTTDINMTNGTTLTMENGTLSGTQNIGIGSQSTSSNIVCGGTCGTINLTGGTVTLYGGGGISNDTDWTFYNLTFDHTTMNTYTTTASGSGKITVSNVLTTDDSIFAGPTYYYHRLQGSSSGVTKTWELTGSVATPFDNRGGFIGGGYSIVQYKGTGSVTVASANDETTNYYDTLELVPASSSSYSLENANYFVKDDLSISANTNLDPGTSNIYVKGSSSQIDGGGQKVYDFTIEETGALSYTMVNTDFEISGTLSMLNSNFHVFTVGSGLTLTLSGPEPVGGGSVNVLGDGTTRFVSTSGGPGDPGNFDTIIRYDASDGNIAGSTVDAGTYNKQLEFYSNVSTTNRTITMGAGTFSLFGSTDHFYIMNDEDGTGFFAGTLTVDGATNNPTVNIGGDLDFPTVSKDGGENLDIGTSTWTVSGNVQTVCDGAGIVLSCFDVSVGNTFIMNGTSKTVFTESTAIAEHFYNFVFSGSIAISDRLYVDNNVSITGTLTASSNNLYVSGDFDNDGTFNNGAGLVVMNGASSSINGNTNTNFYDLSIIATGSGTTTIQSSDPTIDNLLTVDTDDTLTINSGRRLEILDNSTVTLTGTINGAGTLVYSETPTAFPDTGTMDAILEMNPYNGDQTINDRTFGGDVRIICTGAGSPLAARTVTVTTGTVNFNSDLLVEDGVCNLAGVILDLNSGNPTTTIGGDLTINAGGTVSAPTSLSLAGSYANAGAFTDNSGTITLNGTSQQSLSGQMTGSGDDFYNLTITNAGASDPDIIFVNDADVTNNFTATTASSQIQFAASGSYTLFNIDLNGQAAGTRVELTSSTPDTAWDVTSEGTRSVSYTSVKDSNACPSSTDIDASNGTNFDNGGNTCWIFGTIAFDIPDTTVYFGTLDPGSSCYAQASPVAGACTGTEGEAHQLTAETSTSSGYTITVTGPTLTSGAASISAIGGVNTSPNPGSEQFGLRMTASGGSGTVSSPYDGLGFAYDGVSTPDQVAASATSSTQTTYSVRYLSNITSSTEAGEYTTGLTYIMTPLF